MKRFVDFVIHVSFTILTIIFAGKTVLCIGILDLYRDAMSVYVPVFLTLLLLTLVFSLLSRRHRQIKSIEECKAEFTWERSIPRYFVLMLIAFQIGLSAVFFIQPILDARDAYHSYPHANEILSDSLDEDGLFMLAISSSNTEVRIVAECKYHTTDSEYLCDDCVVKYYAAMRSKRGMIFVLCLLSVVTYVLNRVQMYHSTMKKLKEIKSK